MTAPDASLPPIERLNGLPPHELAQALRPLFEAAPPLAEALARQRPFGSYAELLDRAAAVVVELPDAQQVEVLNAHPRIGESVAVVRRTSTLSYREQGYDQEARLDPDEVARVYHELAELNRAYEARFGFRFVVFVNRRPKSAIIDVLRQRLQRRRDEELRTGLEEMVAIARDRLRVLSAG